MKKIGIILGSGLHKFSKELENINLIYEDKSGIHHKKILIGEISGKEVVIFQGRDHFYETTDLLKIYNNVNNAKELDVDLLVITNAAGGVNSNFKVADLMLITSHINLMFRKISYRKYSNSYNKELMDRIKSIAVKNNIKLQSGVYCSLTGPPYETRSEINIWKKMKIDAAGMSTVPEVLYANKIGLKTIAISCITNILNNSSSIAIDHSEVVEAGNMAYNNFSKLLKSIINDY